MTTLTWAEYVPLAIRTASPRKPEIHGWLGLLTEIGELGDAYKKVAIYGKTGDGINFLEEVGDVTWYIALEASRLNVRSLTPVPLVNMGFDHNFANLVNLIGTYATMEDGQRYHMLTFILGRVGMLLQQWADLTKVGANTLEQAYFVNIAKLVKRYGEKYSDQAALVRQIDAERAALECAAKS